jgi:WD40 repeat protein
VGVISAIAFSPDGKSLATASWDHSVRLWDLEDRRCIRKFQGTLSEVWAVTFAPDGKHIISGAKDGTVTFWPTEEERKHTLVEGNWMPLGFSQDSRLMAMLGSDQTLAFFNLKTHEIEQKIGLGRDRNGCATRFCDRKLRRISRRSRFRLDQVQSGFSMFAARSRWK